MPESKPSSQFRPPFEVRQDLPSDTVRSLQRSEKIAELSLHVLSSLDQATCSQQSTTQSQQEDRIFLEIQRGSWVEHYRYSETFSDRLAGILDMYLQSWERNGLHKQPETESPEYCLSQLPRSSLHFCAAFGFEGLARVYLQMGHNPNLLARPSGQCPLHLASAGGHVEIVKMLLDRGADIEARTATTGRTALQIAAFRGRGEVVRVLLENDADINVRDSSCLSAADLALANGYDQILGLLLRMDIERAKINSDFSGVPRLKQTKSLPWRTQMKRSTSPHIQTIKAEHLGLERPFCLKDSCFPQSTPFPHTAQFTSRERSQSSHSPCTNCRGEGDELCSEEESDGWVDVGSDSNGDFT